LKPTTNRRKYPSSTDPGGKYRRYFGDILARDPALKSRAKQHKVPTGL
jgi:hypothetical protein